MIFKRTQQRIDTKLAPLNSIFSSSVLIHESQPNSAFKKPSQECITPKTSTAESSEHFQLFMELDMEYSKEHLMKPMVASQSRSSWTEQLDLQYFQSSAFCWKTHAPLQMSNKGRKRRHVHSASSIYELIYDSVLPKWKKCLKSKANRGIPKALKARPDTIWKKILRDVREFYRMLFRARFHYLEYQNQKGAVTCIQILFSELNIPLNNDEEYLHGVFRYLHQSHKSRFPGLKEDPTPLDAIEKYNEHYRSLYMKDDFGARTNRPQLASLPAISDSTVLIHDTPKISDNAKSNHQEMISKIQAPSSREHFQLFMELEMEYNKEHLMKPIKQTSLDKDLLDQEYDQADMNSPMLCWGSHAMKKKSTKGRKRNPAHSASSIYELIYDSVLPKWKKCLTSKANRRAPNTPKARSDTVWKKILRDVREFYRLLFRARFHYLEYQNQQGAIVCIQTLFSELNIPLKKDEEYLHRVFRYLHQSHKSRFPGLSKEPTPLDAIEKYNEHYRSLYMKDDFGARLLYFVFKNFTPEYCLLIKSRYQREIAEKVCMLLNCYRKMRKTEHLERIEHH